MDQRLYVGPAQHEMEGKYKFLEVIGKGNFSTVFKTIDLVNDEIVAVKKIAYKKVYHGIPSSVIREVSILKELNHDNIVRLLNVYPTNEEICLVFEYMDCDLKTFMKKSEFATTRDPRVIKTIMHQILSAVAFCHAQKVLHRDVKPENVLIDPENLVVKLTDFGLSRKVSTARNVYTSKVQTLQYMAPEVMFGYPHYSFPMDIWGVGCIFSELVTGQNLFNNHQLMDTIQKIFSVMGTPNEATWPGVTKIFPYIDDFKNCPPKNLAEEFQSLEPAGIDLLSKLFCMDPINRITAQDALNHPYFTNDSGHLVRLREETQIFVKIINGQTIAMRCRKNDTLYDLKKKIEVRTGIQSRFQRVVRGGRVLHDESKSLGEYNLETESVIEISGYLLGGTKMLKYRALPPALSGGSQWACRYCHVSLKADIVERVAHENRCFKKEEAKKAKTVTHTNASKSNKK